MKDADRVLAALARDQHQVFSRSQAVAAGLTASDIYRRTQSGAFVVCGHRSLCFAGADLTYRGHLKAGLLDLGGDALVSGRAAAALHHLDGFDGGPLQFLLPRSMRDRTTVGVVTSSPDISRLDRTKVDGLACTSATRSIVELLGRASEREIGNALDSATRLHLTAPSVVRRRLVDLGRKGRAGVTDFDRVMESAGVQSWLERRFLELVRSAGLPAVAIQRTYRRNGTHVARVDFDFEPAPVIVEVGGRRGYLSLDERRRQERRRNALQLERRLVYFFTTEDVVEDPRYVLTTVRLGLSAAG